VWPPTRENGSGDTGHAVVEDSAPGVQHLFDRRRAGELAVMRAQANGARAEYRVIPDITHYDIYREAFDESAEMAREWLNGCLKD